MSRKNRSDEALNRARKAADQLKPIAAQVKPLAKNTSAAARSGLLRSRAWAAPQVERTGQALQENVAPKVSAMLSSAAKRIDPGKQRHRRWRAPVGVATLTAALSAAAAVFRRRLKAQDASPPAEADDVPPTTVVSDGQVRSDTDAAV